jgi:hypothetical protein
MRRLVFILALASAAAPAAVDDNPVNLDFFGADLQRFNAAYGSFFREYYGCPPHAIKVSECDPRTGHLDAHMFHLARDRAKALFGLK